MAQNKKSFLLYADLIHTFEGLEDVEAGKLIKHLLRYVNDLNPIPQDKLTQIAFEPIKQQLKRDLRKWEEIRVKRSEAGKASADKRQQMSTHVESVEQTPTNSTVSVSVNDSVSVNVNDINTNTHEVFKKRLLENELEKESIEVNTREEVGPKIISEFNAHLINESKHHNHYSEWKKHLIRWIPKRFKPEVKKSKDMDRVNKILQTNKELKDEIDREYGN